MNIFILKASRKTWEALFHLTENGVIIMASLYKPVIIRIRKKKPSPEKVLELPLRRPLLDEKETPSVKPLRGITIIKIHGDEKI